MKILIVDDDSIVALSLKTILEAKGLEICALGNSGAQAIELYSRHKPDGRTRSTGRFYRYVL